MKSETRYMMWYYIGHVLTFFQVVVLTTSALFVGLGFMIASGSFIMWQWPDWSLVYDRVLFIVRLLCVVGVFAGFLCLFSGYAHSDARDLAYRRTVKK